MLTRYPASLFYLFLVLFILCGSCKKFVEVPLPASLVESSKVFADEKTATASVTGIYSQLQQLTLSMTNGGSTLYCGLSADEIYPTSATAAAAVFSNNSLLPDNSTVNTNFWSPAYRCIYQCNSIIENLALSPQLPDSSRLRISGEAYCIRAFLYFYLVNFFGEVPLVLSTDYRINSVLPRTSISIIYSQIIKDLLIAKNNLHSNIAIISKARVSGWAAGALLARVYLYTNNWAQAASMASDVISSSAFALTPSPLTVFTGTSIEVIWQLIRDNVNTAEGATFIPSSSTVRPAYALTDLLLNSFESNDLRKSSWLNSNLVGGVRYYYPYKYKVRSGTAITEYNCVLRLAEQYLIRAEAHARQNHVAEGLADLNKIRNRAGLPSAIATDANQLLSLIENERRIELFAEWGHRWLDLKRTGKADEVLRPIKGNNWSVHDELYPIPQASLESNPFLHQNAGY